MSKTHELKCWPEFYDSVALGIKNFEVRKNDRDFQAGDEVELQEYDFSAKQYTGRHMRRRITYVLRHEDYPGGVVKGYCVLALAT